MLMALQRTEQSVILALRELIVGRTSRPITNVDLQRSEAALLSEWSRESKSSRRECVEMDILEPRHEGQ